MATLWRDASEETERIMLDLLRKKNPGERIRMTAELTAWVRELVKRSIRARYPDAGEHELRCRFAAIWLGREWAIRACGWDPHQHELQWRDVLCMLRLRAGYLDMEYVRRWAAEEEVLDLLERAAQQAS